MPAATLPGGTRSRIRTPHGPSGLWDALRRIDPDRRPLPPTRLDLSGDRPSMFAYDSRLAVPLDATDSIAPG